MPRCYGARPYIEAAVADTTSIIALLEGVCDAFNAHDLDQVMKFFAEDCILLMPRGPDPHGRRYEGKAAVREGLATRFAGLPDVHFGQATHYACGDTGIAHLASALGTPSVILFGPTSPERWAQATSSGRPTAGSSSRASTRRATTAGGTRCR